MTIASRAPSTRLVPTERTHHGDTVVDPYEWLRAKDDPAVIAHLESENAHTAAETAHLEPLRELIFEEVKTRTKQDDTSVPYRQGRWWYYARAAEGAQYPVHCRCPAGPDDGTVATWTPPEVAPGIDIADEQVILDCNARAQGHDFYSLGGLEISPDGSLMAFLEDVTGDERFTLRYRLLDTGEYLADEVPDLSYGMVFADDGSVFYVVVDPAWRPFQVRRHVLGTPPSADTEVFTEPNERFWVGVEPSTDRAYLLIGSHSQTTSEVLALPLADPTAAPATVVRRRDGVEYQVDHATIAGRGVFVVVHNDNAEDFAVALAEVGDSDPAHWFPVVTHRPGTRIESVTAMDRALVLSLRRDAVNRVVVIPLDVHRPNGMAPPWEVPFAEELFTTSVHGAEQSDAPVVRIGYQSFLTPSTTYDLDLTGQELFLRKQLPVLGGYDPANYRQYRVWAEAEDGARIPISLVCRADVGPDGTNPVLVYGYGSYEISIDPTFSIPRLSLLDRGVVFAVAHVRGGGELGRSWYEHGRLMFKRNTFTDFVAAGEYLVKSGWAAQDRIAALGGSAGGLLMGAVANLAPELFCGILAQVPFVDPLTTVLDPSLPLTVVEWDQWGDPLHDPDAYAYIKSYAPYDNVAGLPYPPILAMTSLHDTRVLYVEPAKWIARLRAVAPDGGPYLLRVLMAGGHGGASGRYETWRERAYEYSWLLDRMGAAAVPLTDS